MRILLILALTIPVCRGASSITVRGPVPISLTAKPGGASPSVSLFVKNNNNTTLQFDVAVMAVRSSDGRQIGLSATPEKVSLAAWETKKLTLQFAPAKSDLPVEGYLFLADADPIALKIVPGTAPPEAGDDVLIKSGILALLLVCVGLLVYALTSGTRKWGFEMGLASWSLDSWSSNVTLIAGIVTTIVALAPSDALKSFWSMDYRILGAFAAILVVAAPLAYNLVRKGTPEGADPPKFRGSVAMFLVVSFAATWGTLMELGVLWSAAADLRRNLVFSEAFLGCVDATLIVLLLAELYYVPYMVQFTISAQITPPPATAAVPPSSVTARMAVHARMYANAKRGAHPEQKYWTAF